MSTPRIVFLGTPDFAAPFLHALHENGFSPVLVITQPDEPTGRKQILQPPAVKVVAQTIGVPVVQPKNKKELREIVQEYKPDVCVLVAYGRLIPQDILDIPRFGFINAHPSLLPKYRGSSPVQYTLLNQETETGLSLMVLDAEMDQGPILAQERLNVSPHDTNEILHQKLALLGSRMLINILPRYLDGTIKPKPQDHAKATLTKMINRENGLVDWSKAAEAIYAQLRAFTPWPGIFSNFNGKRLKIKDLSVLEGNYSTLKPGTVFIEPNGSPAVQCGLGAVSLNIVQPEGKNEMSGADFLRGYPGFISSVLA